MPGWSTTQPLRAATRPPPVRRSATTPSTDTPVDQQSSLSVVKSAAITDVDGDFKIDLGDRITWSFLVQNTGTTTMSGLVVNDAKAGAVTCPVTTLAPGETTTCTATTPYVITQADVDAGHVANTATATATDPGGSSHTSSPSSTDTTVTRSSSLTVTKLASVTDVNADAATDLGDRIAWRRGPTTPRRAQREEAGFTPEQNAPLAKIEAAPAARGRGSRAGTGPAGLCQRTDGRQWRAPVGRRFRHLRCARIWCPRWCRPIRPVAGASRPRSGIRPVLGLTAARPGRCSGRP